jgi:hypothetical protein
MPGYIFLTVVSIVSSCFFPGSGETHAEARIELACLDSIPVYARPDSSSDIFASVSPGDSLTILVRTEEGWLGFDPGVAQAPNTGSFRYRWISPHDDFVLSGDPGILPEIWGPDAGPVYGMIAVETVLLSESDSLSAAVDTLPPGSAAAVAGRRDGWLLLDPGQGPAGEGNEGWVPTADISVSGDLDSITEI